MIAIKPNDQSDVIEVQVADKVTAQDLKLFEEYFNHKKEVHDKVNLLMVVNEIGYTPQGLFEDIKFDTRHWNDFNKIAVVSDKKWLELSTKVANALPSVEVEHFNLDEKDQAKSWLH
jgi:hypothetical protein